MILPPCQQPTFYFIGVTTGKSSIKTIFPQWMRILGLDAELVGVDVPLHAPVTTYRAIVEHIRNDPLVRGALVTTHKIDLLNAARDLFDELDANALLCGEVSCIARRGNHLAGYAVDPLSSELAWRDLVDDHPSIDRPEVLCFGCGGAAIATTVALAQRPLAETRPTYFTLVDVNAERLAHARVIHTHLDTDVQFDYVLNHDPLENDRQLLLMPPGSVIINATGLGKDLPGSPITDAAIFPQRGRVWEFNYRGELLFLQQAQRQAESRQLRIRDGWHYFLHGWTQVIAEVFQFKLTPTLFAQLGEAAQALR